MFRVIKMKYPYDKNIEVYDGQTHRIKPIQLRKVDKQNNNYYILVYLDYTLKKQMVTFLKKGKDGFTKVPLRDYNDTFKSLQKRVFSDKSLLCDASILGDNIDTTDIIDIEEIMNSLSAPKVATKVQKIVYYNAVDLNYYWDHNCTMIILGAPSSLGVLKNGIIQSHGIDYVIKRVIVDKRKKVTIYYDGEKYYYDAECKIEIPRAPLSLGILEGNKICGKKFIYEIQRIESKKVRSAVRIYHNTYDNKYYWDSNCLNEIGSISSLGQYFAGQIIGRDVIYLICEVYVENKVDLSLKQEKTIESKVVYFKREDGMFYGDEDCTCVIDSEINVFSRRVDNQIIINCDLYDIIEIIYLNAYDGCYYEDKECTRKIDEITCSSTYFTVNVKTNNKRK